jgi:hypothetical protein
MGHTSAAQIPKSISSAFEPHMGVYVDAQDKYAIFNSN